MGRIEDVSPDDLFRLPRVSGDGPLKMLESLRDIQVAPRERGWARSAQAGGVYIGQHTWPAAAALQVEIGQALAVIVVETGLATPRPEATRMVPGRRFPVSLVYRVQGDGVRGIAVAAQRRRSGYWQGRR